MWLADNPVLFPHSHELHLFSSNHNQLLKNEGSKIFSTASHQVEDSPQNPVTETNFL